MKRKIKSDRHKTVRKRTANGKVVSRLVENRNTGERKLTWNMNATLNR